MTSYRLPVAASLVAAAMLAIGNPALAATASPAAKPKIAAKPAPKLAAVKAHPAMVAAKPKPAVPRMAAVRPAVSGRMVKARLGNGQIVTYNCSLAGNQTKQVCKR